MKNLLIIITASLCSYALAQDVERVSPIYGQDQQANDMIRYISENLIMIIPNGKSLDHINGMMRCRITIAPNGKINNIKILNSLVMWLDIVIIEGLKNIPPSISWMSEKEKILNRALVFSFGNKKQSAKYGYNKYIVSNQIDTEINKQQQDNQKKLGLHWDKWNNKLKHNVKLDMPLTPDKHKIPQIPIKQIPQNQNKQKKYIIELPRVEIKME